MDDRTARAVAAALRIVAEEHKRASAFHRRAMERHHEAADVIEAALQQSSATGLPSRTPASAREREAEPHGRAYNDRAAVRPR